MKSKQDQAEYRSWAQMKHRCNNVDSKSYDDYGGRGIKICDAWNDLHGFEAFFRDMGEKPGENYSLERIDNNGNYEPSNCRWATKREQALNRKNARIIEHDGRSLHLVEWADEIGVMPSTITARLKRGLSVAQALGYAIIAL